MSNLKVPVQIIWGDILFLNSSLIFLEKLNSTLVFIIKKLLALNRRWQICLPWYLLLRRHYSFDSWRRASSEGIALQLWYASQSPLSPNSILTLECLPKGSIRLSFTCLNWKNLSIINFTFYLSIPTKNRKVKKMG